MELPYLGGLLTPADVQSKGTGRYAADYVAWAKTMALINQHAPGWWPEIGETHYMADTTAYVDIRFVHPERCTPWFPYAITDNRNNPITADKMTSADLRNAHRRGLCAAAACFFSLSYELWAKEEIEENKPEPRASATATSADTKPEVDPLKERLDEAVGLMYALTGSETKEVADKAMEIYEAKKSEYRLDSSQGAFLPQMSIDQLQSLIDDLKRIKPGTKQNKEHLRAARSS